MTRPALTGSARTDALVPVAAQLAAAVHDHDAAAVAQLLDGADLPALVVLLAAMVPDDLTPSELLAWCDDPAEYARLRAAGVSTLAANGVLAARAHHRKPRRQNRNRAA
ncbi:hypothetical protein [Saccharopolyspora rosea]|uniref:hypothetical protein n=1 Tax=Saccharopolyspora rosea TaxID=524884 RepID=UPI0021DB2883|nr:hypothetical protein [Saccharopolyspora rosea]